MIGLEQVHKFKNTSFKLSVQAALDEKKKEEEKHYISPALRFQNNHNVGHRSIGKQSSLFAQFLARTASQSLL